MNKMKRIYGILAICIFAFFANSCNEKSKENASDNELQTGDLIFVGLPKDYDINASADMASAIMEATGDSSEINYIHVAIAEVENDKVWIIDATIKHGVDRYLLDTFLFDFALQDGSLPIFDIMRLEDNSEAEKFVENAKKYIGRKYDNYFLPDNDEQYCSELVRNSYVSDNGEHLFSENPMNFKSADGSFPIYWQDLFEILGREIPQGLPGTNPNDMSKEKCLKKQNLNLCDYKSLKN